LACGDRAETADTPPPPEGVDGPTAANLAFAPNFSLPEEFRLAEDRQRYIWDIESLAFIMGQDLGSVFKKAVRGEAAEAEKFRSFLAPDFRASVYVGRGVQNESDVVHVERWNKDSEVEWANRDDFIQILAMLGGSFEILEKVDVHTFYLSPEEYDQLDGAWRSRWDIRVAGRFADGRRGEHRFDAEFRFNRLTAELGQEAGWIDEFRFLRARYTTSPRELLKEITNETGIATDRLYDNWNQEKPPWNPVPGTARMFDYDRDGHADLLLTEMYIVPHLFLYRGRGDGTFEDVTAAVELQEIARLGIKTWLTGAMVVDLNNDGFEDLIFSVEQEQQGQIAHAVAVYRNDGGKRFEVVPESVHGLGARFRLVPRGYAPADFDNDGLTDLFLGPVGREPLPEHRKARWVGDQSHREGALVRNLGGFRFEDVTVASGMVGHHIDISSATWLDLDTDGDADLFLGNHMGPNVLWENQGDGTFVERPSPEGFGGFSMGSTAGDLDRDGTPDLYVANMYTSAGGRIIDNLRAEDYPPGAYELIRGFATGNELYANRDSPALIPLGVTADVSNSGWAYGPEMIDLDGDGWLDLFSPAGYQSVERGKPDG